MTSDLDRGERRELPRRRFLETHSFEFFDGVRTYDYKVGIGRVDDEVGEIFLNVGKDGALIGTMSHDCAVLVSLLIQYGCPRDVIRGAVLRNPDNTAAGPVGAVLDMIEQLEETRAAERAAIEA